MSLLLRVDGDRWRAHLRSVADRHPGLVPVAKGNGYGFGLGRLARRAEWLGVDTLAVGLYDELPEVATRFAGDLLVLTPWRPDSGTPEDPRVIHTVSRVADLRDLAATGLRPRVVLERLTSMRRHGMSAADLREAAALVREGGVRLAGVAMHLPLARHSHLGEVERLMNDVVAAELPRGTIWVSHLSDTELRTLATRWAEFTFRPRIGTSLWLGERGALHPRATVLDVHPVRRGEIYGYRGRAAPRGGTIVIVSGGTSHGIGLEAPIGERTLRSRAASVARGGLDAAGFVRSPFLVGGKQRLFAEPPHMQASMLFLPSGSPVLAVGDEIDVRVRYTTTAFDRVEID